MSIGTKTNIGRCIKPNRQHKLLPKHLWNLHPDVTREVISGRRGQIQTGAEWEVTPSGLVLGPTLETIFYRDTDGYPQPQNPEGWTLWTYGWHIAGLSGENAYPCMLTLDGSITGSGGEANRVWFEGDFRQWTAGHFDQFTSYSATDGQAFDSTPTVLLATRLLPSVGKVELVIIDTNFNANVYQDADAYAGSFTDDPGQFDFVAGRGSQICGWIERGLSNGELIEIAKNPHALFEGPKLFALADPLPDTRVLEVPQPVWTSQPPEGTQIDWSNPITNGLKFAWSGTNPTRAIVPGRYGATGSKNETTAGVRRGGHESHATDAGHVIQINDVLDTADFSQDACIVAVFEPDSSLFTPSGNPGRILHVGTDQDDPMLMVGWSSSSGYVEGRCFNGSVRTSQSNTAGGTLTEGEVAVVAAQVDGGGENLTVYTNGVGSSNTAASGNLNSQSTSVGICNSDATEARAGEGYVFAGFVWNRSLTEVEHKSLADNPWQLFKPQYLQVPIEYEELTFDEEKEERLFMIPQVRKDPL